MRRRELLNLDIDTFVEIELYCTNLRRILLFIAMEANSLKLSHFYNPRRIFAIPEIWMLVHKLSLVMDFYTIFKDQR